LKVWDTGRDFQSLLLEDKEIRKHLSQKDIAEIFSLEYHLKHVEQIFQRVFGESAGQRSKRKVTGRIGRDRL
jgi:adenylosuccinate lyase